MLTRRQTEFELETQRLDLAILRSREPHLRATLVTALDMVVEYAARASRKIASREYEDGVVGSIGIDNMREAEEALSECVSDIKYTELQIEDLQNELADEALWVDRQIAGGAQ